MVPAFEGEIVCKVTRLPAKAAQFIYKNDNHSESSESSESSENLDNSKEFNQFIDIDSQSKNSKKEKENNGIEKDFLNGFVSFFIFSSFLDIFSFPTSRFVICVVYIIIL